MGSRTSRAIDYSIDKKLKNSFAIKSPRTQLSKLSNYYTIRKYDAAKSSSLLDEILNVNTYIEQKDLYDNQVCNFLNYKLERTQNRFNLLRLFKPGEILSAVAGSC